MEIELLESHFGSLGIQFAPDGSEGAENNANPISPLQQVENRLNAVLKQYSRELWSIKKTGIFILTIFVIFAAAAIVMLALLGKYSLFDSQTLIKVNADVLTLDYSNDTRTSELIILFLVSDEFSLSPGVKTAAVTYFTGVSAPLPGATIGIYYNICMHDPIPSSTYEYLCEHGLFKEEIYTIFPFQFWALFSCIIALSAACVPGSALVSYTSQYYKWRRNYMELKEAMESSGFRTA
jgi:hypothetical protein